MLKRTVSGIMVTLLLIGVLTLAFNIQRAECSEPPATEWSKTYGGTNFDYGCSVVQTGDGGYAIAGYTESFGNGGKDFWLVKTDGTGNMQWNWPYGGTSEDGAHSLVQTVDGGYAIAGWTDSFGVRGHDFWLVKTDGTGHMQWNWPYGGTSEDVAYSLVQTVDGGYAIAGRTKSFGAGDDDFWLVKTNSTGHMQWNRTYGGTGDEHAYSVIQTLDGGYAMAGHTSSFGAGSTDLWLVKTDPAGNPQWNRTYGGTNQDYSYCVVQTSDGGYAIVGETMSFGAGHFDSWLVKTNSTGHMQWNRTYGGTGWDIAHSVVQTGDGGYVMAGQTRSFGAGAQDFWIVKTNCSGNPQWNQTYGGTATDIAHSVVQTGDGGYAIAGYTESFGAGNGDFWLIKLAGDKTPPTTTIDTSGVIGLEGWFVSDVTVTLTATDELSGVAETKYKIDGGSWNTYQQPFTIVTEGTSTVHYYSIDKAGNIEETKNETVKIDKTPPTVTILSPIAFGIYPACSDETYDFMATDNLDPLPAISAVVYDFEENIYSYPHSGDSLPDESGVYKLVVTATDKAGHTATQEIVFVIYDQSAGFATGGGWIIPEPELSDYKATFGFVAKYHKGATTPNGNLEFQYNYRDINLKSTEIEWLAISNNKAIFQGTATINGEELYTFRVQATDGDLTGDQPDNFMIKIWKGTDTEADPIHDFKGDLAGGNIKIHK
jgi:hypothetical protein